jgi:hypothetical protein
MVNCPLIGLHTLESWFVTGCFVSNWTWQILGCMLSQSPTFFSPCSEPPPIQRVVEEPDWKIYFFPTYTFLNLVSTEAQTEDRIMSLLWCDEERFWAFGAAT